MAKEKKHDEEDLQHKYLEMQLLRQQIGAMVEQKQQLDQVVSEIGSTIDTLKKLESIKKGEEIWSQIGSGTFVKSDIKEVDRVLVAVGAGVVISETRDKAEKILQSRVEELEKLGSEIVGQANGYLERIKKLEPELEKAAKNNNE